jgi:hypothetical protein
MIKAILISGIILLAGLAGCGQRQAGNDDLITVDVTKIPSSKNFEGKLET